MRASAAICPETELPSTSAAAPQPVDAADAALAVAWFEAVTAGDPDTVAAMVERGMHLERSPGAPVVHRRCPRGATALHYAAGSGSLRIVAILVERGGADVNSLCGIAGGTPLMWVSGSTPVAQMCASPRLAR